MSHHLWEYQILWMALSPYRVQHCWQRRRGYQYRSQQVLWGAYHSTGHLWDLLSVKVCPPRNAAAYHLWGPQILWEALVSRCVGAYHLGDQIL